MSFLYIQLTQNDYLLSSWHHRLSKIVTTSDEDQLALIIGTEMGEHICPVSLSQFSEPHTTTHERLIGLRANVALDGNATSFAVQYTNQHAFRVHVPIEQIGLIFSEIRHATNLMFTRQRLTIDRGASKLAELAEIAITPRDAHVMIDTKTFDRLFVFQFLDHAPISLRMSAIQVEYMLGSLARRAASACH